MPYFEGGTIFVCGSCGRRDYRTLFARDLCPCCYMREYRARNRHKKIVCTICAAAFTSTRADAKFCSPACRQKAHRAKQSHTKKIVCTTRDRVHFDARRCKVLFACLPAKGVPRQAISHESGVIPGILPRQRRRRAKPANTGVDAALTSVCLSWPLVSTSRPGRA